MYVCMYVYTCVDHLIIIYLFFKAWYAEEGALLCHLIAPISYWGGYLNISAWFMKNVLFEQRKLEL